MGIKYNECFVKGCKNCSDEGVGFWIMFMPPFGGDITESGYRFICSSCWRKIFKSEKDEKKINDDKLDKAYDEGFMSGLNDAIEVLKMLKEEREQENEKL